MNLLRYDPSRTGTLRKVAEANVAAVFAEVARRVLSTVGESDAFGLAALAANAKHEFGSTHFAVTDADVLAEVRALQWDLDPADVLKLETKPHVTVRYGLHDVPGVVERVNALLAGSGPVTVRVGRLSLFTNPGKPDVLKYSVEGDELRRMNHRLGLVEHTDTFADYHPHMTVAYLREGTGAKYLDHYNPLAGVALDFRVMEVSTPDEDISEVLLNSPWTPGASREQVKAFRDWLRTMTRDVITSQGQEALWEKFTSTAYAKGVGRSAAEVEARRPKPPLHPDAKVSAALGTAMAAGKVAGLVDREKVRALSGRTFDEVRGLSDRLMTKLSRVLNDGIAKRYAPRTVARMLVKEVGIERSRAMTIARTEIIRAHADGQLDALRKLGETAVMANVEFLPSVGACPQCARLAGKVFTTASAAGILPIHPNCKCCWSPAVGSYATGRRSRVPSARPLLPPTRKRAR